jgi:hypothetical protein
MCHEKIVEEFHIEVIVLDDQDSLPQRPNADPTGFHAIDGHASRPCK